MTESPEEWLTIKEAGVYVQVSRRTIYNWLALGKLRARRTAGGSVRVEKQSLWHPTREPLDVKGETF